MMTKTELQKHFLTLQNAVMRLRLERDFVKETESFAVVYFPPTESKKIWDTYNENQRPGEAETGIVIKEKDGHVVYGLYGDHREEMLKRSDDLDSLKKYWKEHPDQWSVLPELNSSDEEKEDKPSIGFGIPQEAKAA
jgi:hypothetical protein